MLIVALACLLCSPDVRDILESKNGHMLPARAELDQLSKSASPGFKPLKNERGPEAKPSVHDDRFEADISYLLYGVDCAQQDEDERMARDMNRKEYQEQGQLLE
jgi:hypothetical protein